MEAQLLHVPCLFPCASPQQCLRGSLPPQEEQPEWQRGKLIVFASHSSSKPQKHDYTCIPRHLELVSPQRGNVDTGSTPHRNQVSDTSCTESGRCRACRGRCACYIASLEQPVQHWAFPRERIEKQCLGSVLYRHSGTSWEKGGSSNTKWHILGDVGDICSNSLLLSVSFT